MTQEQKELLLKDLCARLPYCIKFPITVKNPITSEPIETTGTISDINRYGIVSFVWDYEDQEILLKHALHIKDVKPYLFPLSSMTEEQKYDFYCRFIENDCDFDDFKEFYLDNGMWHKLLTSLDDIEAIIDWFHKNYFDYRGLILKGLAIDATNLNIY